ncbi:MAG: FecCD family ABC transporter permease [Acetivibrio ethanolgignens]
MKKKKYIILGLAAFLAVISFFSITVGAIPVSLRELVAVALRQPLTKTGYILTYIRIPRVIAGIIAGLGLSTAGVIIQTVFHNPLAGPNIIGVNAGAGFFVVLIFAVFPYSYALLPFAAFAGAFLTTLSIYFLGHKSGASKYAIILSDVAVNSILNSALDSIYLLNDNYLISSKLFKIGSISGVNIQILSIAALIIVIAFCLILLLHKQLEILSLGDETAASLGLPIKQYRFLFLLLASVLAGAVISFAGLISFVGLIVPHIARILVGDECRYLLPVSAFIGSILVVLCDTLGRTLFSPYEIPAGIFLSLLGAPFFIFLLLSHRRRSSHD